jgi:CheY-like chemotaxis protein
MSASILVVDDCPDSAESLAQLLQAFGNHVHTARTPSAATFAVRSFRPDVMFIDIGLPGLDGYRLAQRLCERLGYRPKLVALTGYNNLEERSRAEGFDHHFLKPYDPTEIISVVGEFASKSELVTREVA